MPTEIAKACKEVKEIVAEARKKQNEALESITIVLRDQIRTSKHVKGVSWSQYVPGFNDGDACEFTINDIEIKLSDETESMLFPDSKSDDDDYAELDGYHSVSGIKRAIDKTVDVLNHKDVSIIKEMVDDVNRFNDLFGDLEAALQSKWGTNIRITLTGDGITTDDYDCGY